MPRQREVTFQDALEAVEALPEGQRENLIEVVSNRMREERRRRLVRNVQKARLEYLRGETKRGTVDDLMKKISE